MEMERNSHANKKVRKKLISDAKTTAGKMKLCEEMSS